MYNKLWFEIADAKTGEIYLSKYLTRQKDIRKWYKVLTLTFSVSGIFGWAIWKKELMAVIACGLIAAMEIIVKLEPYFIKSESDIDSIGELRVQYLKNLNKFEKLFHELKNNIITDKEASDIFYLYRDEFVIETEALDNRLNIKKVKKLHVSADNEAKDYLNKHYNLK